MTGIRTKEGGKFADVLRFDFNRKKDDPRGKYQYVVEIHHPNGDRIRISCINFTGAKILMDVLNRVLPAPTLKNKRENN